MVTTPRLRKVEDTYGLIYPPLDGAMYEQEGHCFDAHGKYLFSHDGAKMPSENAGPLSLVDQVATMSEAEKATLAKMLGFGPGPKDADNDDDLPAQPMHTLARPHGGPLNPAKPGEGDGDGSAGSSGGEVDLVAWLKGTNYPFYAVRKAVTSAYPDVVTTNSRSIVDGLVAAGVVPADEVTRA